MIDIFVFFMFPLGEKVDQKGSTDFQIPVVAKRAFFSWISTFAKVVLLEKLLKILTMCQKVKTINNSMLCFDNFESDEETVNKDDKRRVSCYTKRLTGKS